jgi:hypothetical protein
MKTGECIFKMSLGLLTIGLLSGCLDTNVPPYFESDVITDNHILGIWVPEKERETVFTITARDDKSYTLKTTENNVSELAILKIFKLGKETFVTSYKEKDASSNPGRVSYETFLYRLDKNAVYLEGIDSTSFVDLIKKII